MASDLERGRFSHEAIIEFLGELAHEALMRDQLIPALRLIAAQEEPAALGTILCLFMLGREVTQDDLEAAFPTLSRAGLETLGLVEEHPEVSGSFRARVDLRPHASDADAEIWVASDLGAHQRAGVLRHDHVLGIGQASLTLAQTTIRPQVESALDLGTGCGIQLFHLLSHAKHVVATDISARALGFTRFNLLLNHAALGLNPRDLQARVQLRLGSLLEPVVGEQFDLVVSNPPFVITPRHSGESEDERFTYRDGGMPGDSLVATLVRELPRVLSPGGSAQMLANWEINEPESASQELVWSGGPRSWLIPGVEAWFIQREQVSTTGYAETWLQDASQGRDRQAFTKQYGAYLDDFASRNVAAIGFGMVWLRRPKNPSVTPMGQLFEEITYPIEQPIGPYLAAAIHSADALDLETLGDTHLVVAEDVTEERHQRPGAEHPGVILLRQGAGLRRTEIMDTALAGFVSACDGDLSVSALVGALDSLLGEGDTEFSQRLYEGVIRLIKRGFLLEMRNNS
ncbi:SAM-dependent methyltransferase [Arthrobacter sp. MYb227]|nr:SAM-dependent methyltransferase [Arthrobacter sp. MYb227]